MAYLKGTKAFDMIVEEFGAEVVGSDGEVNRMVLGTKVFSDKSQLNILNQIVWPAIEELARKKITDLVNIGKMIG